MLQDLLSIIMFLKIIKNLFQSPYNFVYNTDYKIIEYIVIIHKNLPLYQISIKTGHIVSDSKNLEKAMKGYYTLSNFLLIKQHYG